MAENIIGTERENNINSHQIMIKEMLEDRKFYPVIQHIEELERQYLAEFESKKPSE